MRGETLTFDQLTESVQREGCAGKPVETLDLILRRAIAAKVTDIHIRSERTGIRILVRKDGVLRELADFPIEFGDTLFARLKVLGRMVSYQKRVPQDGHIDPASYTDDPSIELRVAIAPVVRGEQAVIRILHGGGGLLPLHNLGWPEQALERYRDLLNRGRGVILLTGPCGSGKTTTIAASLQSLTASYPTSICTVEDPVEYHLPGVSQMAIDETAGVGFAEGVRAWLRHDPDVLAVGEIRDPKAASVAMEAGLLGHLVFSTVHGGCPATVIVRLLDMGITPGTLVASLTALISQRLVRKLCPSCRQVCNEWPADLPASMKPDGVEVFYEPRGCSECEGTGYRGRQGLFEMVPVNDEIREAILNRVAIGQLRQECERAAVCTLWDHGWQLVAQSMTTPRELLRVIGVPYQED